MLASSVARAHSTHPPPFHTASTRALYLPGEEREKREGGGGGQGILNSPTYSE